MTGPRAAGILALALAAGCGANEPTPPAAAPTAPTPPQPPTPPPPTVAAPVAAPADASDVWPEHRPIDPCDGADLIELHHPRARAGMMGTPTAELDGAWLHDGAGPVCPARLGAKAARLFHVLVSADFQSDGDWDFVAIELFSDRAAMCASNPFGSPTPRGPLRVLVACGDGRYATILHSSAQVTGAELGAHRFQGFPEIVVRGGSRPQRYQMSALYRRYERVD